MEAMSCPVCPACDHKDTDWKEAIEVSVSNGGEVVNHTCPNCGALYETKVFVETTFASKLLKVDIQRLVGRSATVTKEGETKGRTCYVISWDRKADKFEVSFGNQWGGWYKLSELQYNPPVELSCQSSK